jgi:hypothetical protein
MSGEHRLQSHQTDDDEKRWRRTKSNFKEVKSPEIGKLEFGKRGVAR